MAHRQQISQVFPQQLAYHEVYWGERTVFGGDTKFLGVYYYCAPSRMGKWPGGVIRNIDWWAVCVWGVRVGLGKGQQAALSATWESTNCSANSPL